MIRNITRVLIALTLAAPIACGGPEPLDPESQVETDKSGAFPVFFDGKWYGIVDSFSEQCSGPTLAIASQPGVTNARNYIQRGVTTIVPYYWWSTSGYWRWWCGGVAERAECSGPLHPTAVERLRVFWHTDSREIEIQCLTQCGDGSSSANCWSL